MRPFVKILALLMVATAAPSAEAQTQVTSGSKAEPSNVAPEERAAEYVRVCDVYGAGYFYIPGSETCLRIHGHLRYSAVGGDDVYARGGLLRDPGETVVGGYNDSKRDAWEQLSRFTLRVSTGSETELGSLKTFAEMRFDWIGDGTTTPSLRYAYAQLGGLRIGLDDSAFVTFTGYLGDFLNDDVISAGGYRTNLISYTYAGENGISATLSFEQGNAESDVDGTIDGYMPHVVGGVKVERGWGKLAAAGAFDARNEEWVAKVRGDINISDRLLVWAQGAYKTKDDIYDGYTDVEGNFHGVRQIDSFYGTWGGAWAVWAGAAYLVTDKATFNVQLAYDATRTFAATANVAYELVRGFTITPEVSYTKWDDRLSVLEGQDALQGMVQVELSF